MKKYNMLLIAIVVTIMLSVFSHNFGHEPNPMEVFILYSAIHACLLILVGTEETDKFSKQERVIMAFNELPEEEQNEVKTKLFGSIDDDAEWEDGVMTFDKWEKQTEQKEKKLKDIDIDLTTINKMRPLTDYFFEDIGFDISEQPFVKKGADETEIIYKNYYRDGSGEYNGYVLAKPKFVVMKTINDYLCA